MAATTTLTGNMITVSWGAAATGDWSMTDARMGQLPVKDLAGGQGPFVDRIIIASRGASPDSYVLIRNGMTSSAPVIGTLKVDHVAGNSSQDLGVLELHTRCRPYIDWSGSNIPIKVAATRAQVTIVLD
jgi:hypothetical protein